MSDISVTGKASGNRRVAAGEVAPDFALPNAATGETIRLSELRGRDILLLFFRGTWCPFCREQMGLLAARHDRLTTSGIATLGILCQSQAGIRRYLEANPLPFPLLADETRQVAKQYGTHYWLTHEGFNLSHPALFILNGDGAVTFAHVGKNMADLPVETVLGKFLQFLDGGESPNK